MEPRVIHVVGARPNYMKVAPVWRSLTSFRVDQMLIHTGQHYDYNLSDVFLDELALPPPDLSLHVGSGSHGQQTARALERLEEAFLRLDPQIVIAPGDVNSTLAAALAAAKLGIAVCHVEAGLRSYDSSMPEEHNRRLTDHLSSLLLTTSADANENLEREGITAGVDLVGNTMIDSLVAARSRAEEMTAWRHYRFDGGDYVLVTLHRPTLVDDPEKLRATVAALAALSETIGVIFPVHPRTKARLEDLDLRLPPSLRIEPPLPYSTFLSLELGAAGVITDSGGIQEETTALGVRCFTLRANTERPITVEQGTNTLLGLEPDRIGDVLELLREPRSAQLPALWDGQAGARAAAAIAKLLGAERR